MGTGVLIIPPSGPQPRAGLACLFQFYAKGRSQGRGAAVRRGLDDLLAIFLPQVADDVDSRDIGLTPLVGHHVAVVIQADARRHQLVIGDKADEDEYPVGLEFPGRRRSACL